MINRPQPGEYAQYAAAYVNKVPDGNILELLVQLKESSYHFFAGMSDEQANYAYAEGKWTLKQVLSHIIDAERVFSFRAFCFSRGDENPLPGFNQDDYVKNAVLDDRSIQDLAAEFRTVRESSIYIYGSLTEEQQLLKGIASNNPVTVRALVYMTAGHELYHLDLIKERYLR